MKELIAIRERAEPLTLPTTLALIPKAVTHGPISLLLKSGIVTGSQHLYGPGRARAGRREFAADRARSLNASGAPPLPVVFKPVLTRPEEIRALCLEAKTPPNCAGLILWMHTFSPSKMWIGGLSALIKPFLHLHTQFNRDLPWGEIDMDFMNLQPVRARRPRGGLHPHPPAAQAQGGGGPLVGSRGAERDRRLDARGARLARLAGRQSLPVSATTCGRSRSPKATRWRRKRASVSRSTATAWAISWRR